ncbi:otoancorin-like isoform X3 [Branchiostoma lanceolatum]|uniref:otoancorin-like isoform X1 n=1 Tax=Branchiostoma lanceolatum TaxID=7740 RepID=UPI0034561869
MNEVESVRSALTVLKTVRRTPIFPPFPNRSEPEADLRMRSAVLFVLLAAGLVAAVPREKRQAQPQRPTPQIPARPTAPSIDPDVTSGITAAFGDTSALTQSSVAKFINNQPANSSIIQALKGEADITDITDDEFKMIPGNLLTKLNDDEFAKITSDQIVAWLLRKNNQFDLEQLDVLSVRVEQTKFVEVLTKMKDAAEPAGDPDARPTIGLSADVQAFLVRKWVEANVNVTCDEMPASLEKVSFMPRGLTPGNLKKLRENSDQNCEPVANKVLEMGGGRKRYCMMSAEARKEACEFAREAAGNQKDTKDNLLKLPPFTDCLTAQDLEGASADLIIDLYDNDFFKDIDEMPAGGNAIIRTKLEGSDRMPQGADLITFFNNVTRVEKLGPAAVIIGDMIGDLSQLEVRAMKKMKQTISGSRVCNQGETEASQQGPSKEEKELDRKLLAAEMSDPASVSAATLQSLAGSLSELQPDEIENLSEEAVVGAISELAGEGFTGADARALIDKYKSGAAVSGALSAAQLSALGSLAGKLPTADIDQMSDADVRSSISTFASAKSEMSPQQIKKIAKKARTGNLLDQLANDEIDPFFDALPLKDLEDNADGIAADVANGDYSKYSDLQMTDAQATLLFGKMVEGLSELDRDTVISMGNAVAGATPATLDLISNDNFPETINALSGQANFGSKMTRKIAKRLKDEILPSSFADLSQTDLDTIPADVIPDMSTEDLGNVAAALCEAVAQKVAGSERLFETQEIRQQKHSTNALRCLGKETSGDLGESDMATMGNLICGAEDAVLGRVDASGARTALENLQNCPTKCLSEDRKTKIRELFETYTANTDASSIDAEAISTIGLNAYVLSDDFISALPNDVVSQAVSLADSVDVVAEEQLAVQDSGCGIDRTAMFNKIKEATTGSSGSRRRRQATVYTCTQVQDLGNAAVSLTEAELSAMTSAEFTNCLEFLGGLTGWSTAQLELMRDRVFSDIAAAGSLTTDQVFKLGKIATAFTTTHLSALDLSDIDAVYNIAQHSGYSAAQTEAAFTRYLGSTAVSAISSEHLVGLSNFLGGMTTAQIAQIDSTAFTDSVANIGNLTVFSTDQFTALKEKAVSASGATSSWSAATVTNVGTVAAGLTEAELTALTDAQVPAITPGAIALIPGSTLANGLSVAQLNLLSMEQAQAVTNDQYSALSTDQKAAVDLAQYGPDDVADAPPRSGVSAVHACVMLVFSAVLIRLL